VYRVELTHRAQHELDKLRGEEFERVVVAIRGLQNNARPFGVVNLKGPIHRIRSGDWRIIYAVFDNNRLVIVGKIARRSEDSYNNVDRLF
jgi:mRNA interferase RelE/StbE